MNWADESLVQGNIFNKSAALVRLGGDEELYQDLLEVFFEELPQLVSNLQLSLEGQTSEVIADAAHTLKGAALNLGAERLASLCLRIEKWCKEGKVIENPSGLSQRISQLQNELESYR